MKIQALTQVKFTRLGALPLDIRQPPRTSFDAPRTLLMMQ